MISSSHFDMQNDMDAHTDCERRKSIDGCDAQTLKKMRYTNFVVRHPFLTQFFTILVILVCGVYLESANVLGISEQSENDYLIMSDKRVIEKNTLELAYEEVSVEVTTEDATLRSSQFDSLFILYSDKSDSKNMLTSSKIKVMESVEKTVIDSTNFLDFCLASEWSNSSACSQESYLSSLESGIADEGSDLEEILQSLAQPDILTAYSSLFFSPEFEASNLQSTNMRALVQFGLPLEGYSSEYDRYPEQEAKFLDYMLELHADLQRIADNDADVEVLWYNQALFSELFLQQSMSDLSWAVCSMSFVFAYMWFHTKSFYLALIGIFEVLASFVPGYFIYSTIIQVEFFQTLHILAIFVILGIGADNIFVFTDAWNQMKVYPQLVEDDELRMAVAFRRAAKATLATSFTTFSAFMATGISKIMPIATFAYFASCIILCDFVLCLTFYTPALIIHHKYLCKCQKVKSKHQENLNVIVKKDGVPSNPVRLKSGQVSPTNEEDCNGACPINTVLKHREVEVNDKVRSPVLSMSHGKGGQLGSFPEDVEEEEKESANIHQSRISHFFEQKYSPIILRFRYPILAVFFSVFVVMASMAGQLEPLSAEEQWLPDHTFVQKTLNLMLDGFQYSDYDDLVVVKMVWGLEGLDRSGYNRYKPDEPGSVIWDETFDLTPEENQEFLITVCEEVQSQDLLAPTLGNTKCFMQDFKQYRLSRNESFPVPESLSSALMAFVEESGDFGENVVFDSNNDIRFVTLEFKANLNSGLPYAQTYPEYEKWEDFVTDLNSQAPPGLDNGMQTAGMAWCWMISERSFVSSLVQGMSLSISMAFVVLTLATQNIIVSLFATLSICGIVACVLGSAHLLGWQLGIAESISGVILIGFSVDYVVHIGELYVKYGKQKPRYYKVQQTLKSMGVSIVGGALTTFGSGVFLFACTILFFEKFAILICLTICMSFCWSLGFLATLLITIGPENDYGSLKTVFAKIWCKEK